MAKRLQKIKIPDYGDDWINRLAVAMLTFEKMEPEERRATLVFLKSKFSKEWPGESY